MIFYWLHFVSNRLVQSSNLKIQALYVLMEIWVPALWRPLQQHVARSKFQVFNIYAIIWSQSNTSSIALFEPTSVPKSLKLFDHVDILGAQSIQYTSPNQYELEAMCDTILSHPVLSLKAKLNSNHQKLNSKLILEPAYISNLEIY